MKRSSPYYLVAIAILGVLGAWQTPRWMESYRRLWSDGQFPTPWVTMNVVNHPFAPWIAVSLLAVGTLAVGLWRRLSETALLQACIGLAGALGLLLLRHVLAFSFSFNALTEMK
jgi:hypothetical protein